MKTVPWNEGPPTEPGYYWWTWLHPKIAGPLYMSQVYYVDDVLVVFTDGTIPVTKPLRRWAGPMPVPPKIEKQKKRKRAALGS